MPEYIGVYRLESPLGKGGMGEVFLAWDERLERRVAVKRVRRDAFTAPHQRDRFRREARMAARLSHAAIVQIHDLVNVDSGDAIVMEYVEGITLKERVARGLPAAEAVRLAGEIARGLAAAHSAGLIHRDLKAENVIVTPAGHAKILDFGLARPVDPDEEQLTQQGAIVGTSYAMSPEQANGEELDERSDLFSFGALLYEMLSGRSPFRGKNSLETLKRVLTEQPSPLASVRPDLPPGLTSLVDRLLAKNRDERPGSAEEVASRLERIERGLLGGTPEPEETISDLPTAAFPVIPRTSPERASAAPPLVRGKVLLVAALLVVATGIVHLALEAVEWEPEPQPVPLQVLMKEPLLDPEDEARLQEIHKAIESLEPVGKTDLEQLDQIIDRSPSSLDAHILAAKVAIWLYRSTDEPGHLKRARSAVEASKRIAPNARQTLRETFNLAVLENDHVKARGILRDIEALTPGDPDNLFLKFRLLDSQGDIDGAYQALSAAAEKTPASLLYGYWLADLERRSGRIEEAIKRLAGLPPGNNQVREQLAFLELMYGVPEQAEKIYRDLADSNPRVDYFTNLGLALWFQEDYKEAKQAYRNALALNNKDVATLLNLADVERKLEDPTNAEVHCRNVLDELDKREETPGTSMIRAQCFAHLGQPEKAREAVRLALARPDDPQLLYEASLVYYILGDREEALNYARSALDGGIPKRRFTVSPFGDEFLDEAEAVASPSG